VESGGAGLALAAARAGLHVFGVPDARSRIRGGHNFYDLRFAEREVYAHKREADLLVALNEESISAHSTDLAPASGVIYPEELRVDPQAIIAQGHTPMPLPLKTIAEENGGKVMINTGAIAAAAAVVGLPFEFVASVIRRNFAKKGAGVVGNNVRVARASYVLAEEKHAAKFPWKVGLAAEHPERMLINGNQAFALGALAGGCRFMSAYPMTPATTILERMTSFPAEYGVVTKQTEDEIAAVCMAIGASFAGARAMTATSGGGLCLMVEAIGLAGMAEVPLVVVNAQRGGPSTGLPTRTEQSDLLFAINAGHGEFPRVVLAPSNVAEAFEAGWRSFNLADRYQCPVIVLTDTLLAGSLKTVDPTAFDFGSVVIDRGETLTDSQMQPDGYHRFELTASGVSPRALPGNPHTVFAVPSDEHDEEGHITEEAANRVSMMEKRMRKLNKIEEEMRGPELIGAEDVDVTLACWGSTAGACLEAAQLLRANGIGASVLKFTDLWPLPQESTLDSLMQARRVIAVEQNYTGQLAQVVRACTGFDIEERILNYGGRPLTGEAIAEAVREKVGAHAVA
jgi:2-oxoglutarate ferredoxin oxidoreductase subunit alpha